MTVAEKLSRNEIVENNLGLVHSLAARFKGRGVEYDDLFQAGCMGLLRAAEGFDEDRGLKFSTYAVPVILGEIKRIFRDTGPIKVSRSLKEKALKASRIREDFIKKEGYEPPVSYIAEKLDISPAEASEALLASLPPVSLTRENDDEQQSGYIDIPFPSHEDALGERLSLKGAIEKLSDEDKKLVSLRFYKTLTQSDTAKILGITQVQVSRREAKIIKELREFLTK
jgi:RNA polymerase sporulation-specific sigma factor